MTVIAATAWGGIALFLVPLPVATILLILGARRERADTLLLMGVAITLLPAVWATALRAEWGGCNGCLSGSDKDWMILALPSVPLLAAAAFLLFTGRAE